MLKSFPWQRYSQQVIQKIKKPQNGGSFSQKETEDRGMRWVTGIAGSLKEGNFLKFYWMVDPEDGNIVDAKYQLFGQTALIAAAEIVTHLLIGKNYDQARRIGVDLIKKEAEDKKGDSFPKETHIHLNLVIDALDDAAEECLDIPLPNSYVALSAPQSIGQMREGGFPGWDTLPLKEQLAIIDEVLNQDIRPYIALDAGGVEVINLINKRQLIITYQGSCTSCAASSGTTLSYIQQVLKAKIHPEIEVTPS